MTPLIPMSRSRTTALRSPARSSSGTWYVSHNKREPGVRSSTNLRASSSSGSMPSHETRDNLRDLRPGPDSRATTGVGASGLGSAQSAVRASSSFRTTKGREKPQPNTALFIAFPQRLVPAGVGSYLHAAIPSSDLVELSATGHFPHVSGPDETTRVIRRYLDDVEN